MTGSGFTLGTIRVCFWRGVPASVTVRSDSTMDVVVPSAAVTGPLGVQLGSGVTNYTAANFTRIGSGPSIFDLSPTLGPTNQLVVINGVHFAGLALDGVRFNGTRAVDASVSGDGTSISVHVPFGATTGPVSVTTPTGTSNSPSAFVVLGPGPYITDFTPVQGAAGTHVLVDGLQFSSATGVNFNGAPGANFVVRSETLISVDAPAGVTSGQLTVLSPLGNYTSVGTFYVPPAITNVAPASGRAGTAVTIKGLNFRGATSVTFGNTPAAYSVLNNNAIQAVVPAGAVTGEIRVSTPPNNSCFSAQNFVILPTLSGFSPDNGPVGTTVTISGANLNVGSPTVYFNRQPATPISANFAQITVKVPAGATTGRISVTTGEGVDTNSSNFYLPPAITSFSPTNSAPGSSVLIQGANFVGTTQVLFNGAPASVYTVNSNTSLTVSVPAGVTTGPLKVVGRAATATSSGLFYAQPLITGFSPAKGLPGTNVTILGTNFLGARAVRFNGLLATISSLTNGQIVAGVPPAALTGPISVEAPAGTYTTPTNFVVDYNSNLEVWMTNSPAAVLVGSNMTFSITMVNRGPFNAPAVLWTNAFPASFMIDSVTAPVPWTYIIDGTTVVAASTNATVGGTSTILVTARPQAYGTFVASSAIGSGYPDYLPANNGVALNIRVDPLPMLSIRRGAGQVTLSWLVALTNYVLESKADLSGATWESITNVSTAGSLNYFSETNAGLAKFYRLKR